MLVRDDNVSKYRSLQYSFACFKISRQKNSEKKFDLNLKKSESEKISHTDLLICFLLIFQMEFLISYEEMSLEKQLRKNSKSLRK